MSTNTALILKEKKQKNVADKFAVKKQVACREWQSSSLAYLSFGELAGKWSLNELLQCVGGVVVELVVTEMDMFAVEGVHLEIDYLQS